MIQIFKRRAWKKDSSYEGGYAPLSTGHKTRVMNVESEEEARIICRLHNNKRTKQDDLFFEWTVVD